MTPAAAPMVFAIDDDGLVRAAIQGMLRSVGLRSETFGTPQEFLRSKRPTGRHDSRSASKGIPRGAETQVAALKHSSKNALTISVVVHLESAASPA
jgi:hypothetical protein